MKEARTHHNITLRLSEGMFTKLEDEANSSGNSVQAIIRNIVAAHYAQPVQHPEVSA